MIEDFEYFRRIGGHKSCNYATINQINRIKFSQNLPKSSKSQKSIPIPFLGICEFWSSLWLISEIFTESPRSFETQKYRNFRAVILFFVLKIAI